MEKKTILYKHIGAGYCPALTEPQEMLVYRAMDEYCRLKKDKPVDSTPSISSIMKPKEKIKPVYDKEVVLIEHCGFKERSYDNYDREDILCAMADYTQQRVNNVLSIIANCDSLQRVREVVEHLKINETV